MIASDDPNGFVITNEFMRSGMGSTGCFSREQMEILGAKWPPTKGWKWTVMGARITEANAKRFLELRGDNKRRRKEEKDLSLKKEQPTLGFE